ncbi:hypothetical protein BDZ91DRAFT_760298 [Kalaharituber pfeilii]|nr:hypothetical protein BDZ91DRAFT_760298 [Kalaharituber pfeilii]
MRVTKFFTWLGKSAIASRAIRAMFILAIFITLILFIAAIIALAGIQYITHDEKVINAVKIGCYVGIPASFFIFCFTFVIYRYGASCFAYRDDQGRSDGNSSARRQRKRNIFRRRAKSPERECYWLDNQDAYWDMFPEYRPQYPRQLWFRTPTNPDRLGGKRPKPPPGHAPPEDNYRYVDMGITYGCEYLLEKNRKDTIERRRQIWLKAMAEMAAEEAEAEAAAAAEAAAMANAAERVNKPNIPGAKGRFPVRPRSESITSFDSIDLEKAEFDHDVHSAAGAALNQHSSNVDKIEQLQMPALTRAASNDSRRHTIMFPNDPSSGHQEQQFLKPVRPLNIKPKRSPSRLRKIVEPLPTLKSLANRYAVFGDEIDDSELPMPRAPFMRTDVGLRKTSSGA